MAHLLVVEDEPNQRLLCRRVFELFGHAVATADSAEEAIQELERSRFDLVMTDWNLPGMDGIDLAQKIREEWPGLPVVLVTGSDEGEARRRAAGSGIRQVVGKPWLPDDLEQTVIDCLGKVA